LILHGQVKVEQQKSTDQGVQAKNKLSKTFLKYKICIIIYYINSLILSSLKNIFVDLFHQIKIGHKTKGTCNQLISKSQKINIKNKTEKLHEWLD
jgi:hypothetical protein